MGGGDDMGERMARPADAVIISSNENPLGMSTSAMEAISKLGTGGGRYHQEIQKSRDRQGIQPAVQSEAGLRQLLPGLGRTAGLWRSDSNVGPDRDLVVGEPSYEQGASAGAKMKANVHRVPLTETGAHDVKAMVTAGGPTPGAFYIVNPNNPTGTMTPKADIVWLVKNKPAGSVVVIDEAYHHFSNDESSIDLVAADQDVIVLRTFSKVYGMAGMRAWFLHREAGPAGEAEQDRDRRNQQRSRHRLDRNRGRLHGEPPGCNPHPHPPQDQHRHS